MNFKKYFSFFLLLFLSLILSACASKPSNFFLLNPIQTQSQSKVRFDTLAIGLYDIHLPKYLDRTEIVSRKSMNELNVHDFDLWGEPLEKNISSVVKLNLEQLLPGSSVVIYPWPGSTKVDYNLEIYFEQYDQNARGQSILKVKYKIITEKTHTVLVTQSIYLLARIPTNKAEAVVFGMNQNLNRLCQIIANRFKALYTTRHYE